MGPPPKWPGAASAGSGKAAERSLGANYPQDPASVKIWIFCKLFAVDCLLCGIRSYYRVSIDRQNRVLVVYRTLEPQTQAQGIQ